MSFFSGVLHFEANQTKLLNLKLLKQRQIILDVLDLVELLCINSMLEFNESPRFLTENYFIQNQLSLF